MDHNPALLSPMGPFILIAYPFWCVCSVKFDVLAILMIIILCEGKNLNKHITSHLRILDRQKLYSQPELCRETLNFSFRKKQKKTTATKELCLAPRHYRETHWRI